MFGIDAFPEHLHYGFDMTNERPDEAATETIAVGAVPTCGICRRQRTLGDGDHPMDAYDYTPMQVITNQPLGWYSGDDGEVCPEDMEQTIRGPR